MRKKIAFLAAAALVSLGSAAFAAENPPDDSAQARQERMDAALRDQRGGKPPADESVGARVKRDASDAGHAVSNGAHRAGHAVSHAASETGHAVSHAASETGHAVSHAASATGHAISNGVHRTGQAIHNATHSRPASSAS